MLTIGSPNCVGATSSLEEDIPKFQFREKTIERSQPATYETLIRAIVQITIVDMWCYFAFM